MPLPRLHLITATGGDPLPMLRGALGAGEAAVQVRAKGAADRDFYHLGSRVRALCLELGGHCIINDRLDMALAVGASGVHLGEDDLPVEAARRVAGPTMWVGATARDPEAAGRLEAKGANYLGVGPAYPTSTKSGLPDPLGPEGIAKVVESVTIPVIAIGGVTALRVHELLEAGAYGVAVVSAVSEAEDPQRSAAELLDALGEAP
ncbi:MAG: thiamine phosphate synthase [Actinomycetota bacterium]|nr:thiamine phosphate synthase [Actinomycetota bacterium]